MVYSCQSTSLYLLLVPDKKSLLHNELHNVIETKKKFRGGIIDGIFAEQEVVTNQFGCQFPIILRLCFFAIY